MKLEAIRFGCHTYPVTAPYDRSDAGNIDDLYQTQTTLSN